MGSSLTNYETFVLIIGYIAFILFRKENLGNLKANIELLEQYPDADYLFSFMQDCLDKAKNQYFKEKEMKND